MADTSNIYIDQATDFAITLNLFEDDGEVFDITVQQLYCNVRKLYSSSIAFSPTFVIEPGGQIGVVEMRVAAADTANLQPGKYTYDILMVNANGAIIKLVEGLIILLPTMSRIPTP